MKQIKLYKEKNNKKIGQQSKQQNIIKDNENNPNKKNRWINKSLDNGELKKKSYSLDHMERLEGEEEEEEESEMEEGEGEGEEEGTAGGEEGEDKLEKFREYGRGGGGE